METRRDDLLIDDALTKISENWRLFSKNDKELRSMAAAQKRINDDDPDMLREARRILRRMCEKGAFLAVSPAMPKAVVLRPNSDGGQTRIAVLERSVANIFALKDWISCETKGKVLQYSITTAGRAALKRLLDEDSLKRQKETGFAEKPSVFQSQHKDWAERTVTEPDGVSRKKMRYNLAESPLTSLARKKDKAGNPFLTVELLEAGERLREDFELAHLGPRVAQNWDRFLTGAVRQKSGSNENLSGGAMNARDRVHAALKDLGPGLSDIVMRCCCFLEGMETAEKRMGWSARSGKIVLRIALQRLRVHYEQTYGGLSPKIE